MIKKFLTVAFFLTASLYYLISCAEADMDKSLIFNKVINLAKTANWKMAVPRQIDNENIAISGYDFKNNKYLTIYQSPSSSLDMMTALSPDGKKIGFWINNHYETDSLFIVNYEGGEPQKIIEMYKGHGVCWSPDSRKIAFVGAEIEKEESDQLSLFIVDIEGKNVERLVVERIDYMTSQCWSPDGKELLYVIDGIIMSYNFDSKASCNIVNGNWPAWSPLGDAIAYLSNGNLNIIIPDGTKENILVKGASLSLSKATPGAITTPFFWLPNGQFIIYGKCLDQHCEMGKPFIVDINTKETEQILQDEWLLSSWSK
jgi:Tol biopolymer transport system component